MYVAAGERFEPSGLTRGPWDRRHQHGGPPAALLARAIEAAGAIPGAAPARISFDILRPVPIEPLVVGTRIARPGRRVELVEASLAAVNGAEVMRAAGWRIRGERQSATEEQPPPAPPEHGDPGSFDFWRDDVAYHRALDWRFISGSFDRPGPATVWTRLGCELVSGEDPTPLERLIVMADAASGVSAMLDWERSLFINVELGIHLRRPPRGEWMAMDAQTRIGADGTALCSAELYDLDGHVGMSTQSLLLAARP